MIYIENEGALFRGPARAWPKEVWVGGEWKPYSGNVPKDVDWGNVIDDTEAKAIMGDAEAQPADDADKGQV